MECQAAVVTALNSPLELQQVPFPEMEAGSMMMRVEAATLCGTDVHIWHNGTSGAETPYIPGHETAGRIDHLEGKRADIYDSPLTEGDRIISAYRFCGHCFYCSVANQPTLCADSIRFGRARVDRFPYLLGGLAQYHYIPPGTGIVRVPDSVSSPLAASAACALRTVMHGYERLGVIRSNETVVVQGSGPVGLYATAVAVDKGARQVLVIGAPEGRLQVAEAWGAKATLNLDDEPDPSLRKEWVLDQTGGRGADVVVQAANAAAIAEGFAFLRPGGRYLSIGGGGGPISIPSLPAHTQIVSVRSAEARHFDQALAFLDSRGDEFPFESLLSDPYPLDKASEAMQAMAEMRDVKAVVLPNG